MVGTRRLIPFLLLLALLVGSSSCFAQETIRVSAEGAAAVEGGDLPRARAEAKRQAYRDALEKGVGAYVHGITEMKDFAVVRDKVFSQSQGIVTSFTIIDEGEADGIYTMEADCLVATAALDGVLGPAVIDALGNPRVMVLVDEAIEGQRPFLSTVEGEVLRVFEKAGYLLVDAGQAGNLDQRQIDLARETGDVALLQELARSFRADVLIYGKAQGVSYAKQKVSGVDLYGVRSQVQLKAVIAQTAYVLGTEAFEARDKGTSAQDGAVKAFKPTSRGAASALVNKVAYALVSGSAGSLSGRTVKVFIDKVSFSQLRDIKATLEGTRGVVGVYQRAFGNGKAELDVVTENTAEDLAVELEKLSVEVTGLTANTIEGKRVP